MKILPRLTDNESMKSALLQYQKSLKAEFGDIIQKEIGAIKTIDLDKNADTGSEADLKKLAEDLTGCSGRGHTSEARHYPECFGYPHRADGNGGFGSLPHRRHFA